MNIHIIIRVTPARVHQEVRGLSKQASASRNKEGNDKTQNVDELQDLRSHVASGLSGVMICFLLAAKAILA